MTYSQDDSFFAVGHQNGVLQLWKVCSSASASTEVQQQTPEEKCTEKELLQLESLLIRTQQLNISNKGFKYHSKDDDFTLTVPEGAVPTGDSISIQVGVVPYGPVGPFKYPDGIRPVSPIVWLCSIQLVDKQFQEHYDVIRNMVRLGEGPDRALEIKIQRNDSEANGWQTALSQKRSLPRKSASGMHLHLSKS